VPLFGILIFIIAIVVIRFFSPQLFPNLFTAIARPFWRIEFSLLNGQLRSTESLLSEKEDLIRKLEVANLRTQTASIIMIENDQLKSLMGRASSTDMILSAVLRMPPNAPYDELLIDAGTDYDFKVDNMIYAAENVPVGKIVEVLSHSSKVRLFSSPGQKFEVLIGNNRIRATALGRGGGQYEAELPRDSVIAEGDSVSIPSLTTNLYGVVDKVISDPSDPFETILFSAPIDLYKIRWVLVDTRS